MLLAMAVMTAMSRTLAIVNAAETTTTTATCPRGCFCNPQSRIVYCSRRGLFSIPTEIPSDALELNLNGNQFQMPYIRRANFSSTLARLERLYLSDCGIETIQPDAFRDMTQLKWLDLSSNRIREIQPNSFASMPLQHLFLNGNRQLRLSPESFAGGLRLSGLYLHDCSLSSLSPDVLSPLNGTLKNLWLNGNAIERLNRRHYSLFASLSHLRLASNPFHCNCESAWLKELLDSRQDLVYGSPTPSCSSPARLKGMGFEKLLVSDFFCLAPVFNNIDTQFDNIRGRLRCAASGDPVPTLYWIRPTGEVRRYAPVVSLADSASLSNEAILTMDSGKEIDSLSGMYICIATNEGGNVTLTVNVSWPRTSGAAGLSYRVVQHENAAPTPAVRLPSTTLTPASKSTTSTLLAKSGEIDIDGLDGAIDVSLAKRNGSSNNNSNGNKVRVPSISEEEGETSGNNRTVDNELEHYKGDNSARPSFMERTYSLTEMVCAVVGVHVSTVLLVLMLIWCYQKRRRSSSSVFRYSARDKRPMSFKSARSPDSSCNAFGQRFLDYPISPATLDVYSQR